MVKPYKIYINSSNPNKILDTFPLKVLTKNFRTKIVNSPDIADLMVDFVERGKDKIIKKSDKKILIIAGDNLNFKKNLFSLIESIINKIGFKKQKYKIMDLMDKILPKRICEIPIMSFFRNYEYFFRNNQNSNKIFLLTTNKMKIKNSISIPLFIQNYFYKLQRLKTLRTPSEKELKKKKFCAFVVSSNSSRERIKFFKELSKYKRVDSYGKVMNNMGSIIQSDHWKNNDKIFRKYKFVICFENSFSEDYITEKLPNVMFANTIPIYKGAPNVGEYFNLNSFINYETYGSYKKMIKKIIELDKDDKKYIDFLKNPWFYNNEIPQKIINKPKELIKFYKKLWN